MYIPDVTDRSIGRETKCPKWGPRGRQRTNQLDVCVASVCVYVCVEVCPGVGVVSACVEKFEQRIRTNLRCT